MGTMHRYLTKTRFKVGHECPTKLYFYGKPEFGNNNSDSAFLHALAEGGFQVGELAKVYHEGGIQIETLDSEEAIKETAKHLKRKSVILYEAAIKFQDLFVRVDVLRKTDDVVELIEVKAKSFDPTEEDPFYNKRELKKGIKKIHSEWEPYLLDIAFQTHVVRGAFPKWKITSALMLADKSSEATVDGLNQLFSLETDSTGRTRAVANPKVKKTDLGVQVLTRVGVDEEVRLIFGQEFDGKSFSEYISCLSAAFTQDKMIAPLVGSRCKSCEYRIDNLKKQSGLKSGFETCWSHAAKFSTKDFERPLVLDVWNFRKSDNIIKNGRYFMDSLEEGDIEPRPRPGDAGLSNTERQWIQITAATKEGKRPYLDHAGLSAEILGWTFPLHFIDFETTMVAIPFNKGRKPYEQIAFQFSHHVFNADGTIEHKTEYINREQGKFPNFEFVRALRLALSNDSGTIFRYAAHENTVLTQIRHQLKNSSELDRQELIEWIESITKSCDDSIDKWEGKRNMVDLCDIIKRYYYHPETHGSNSIKKVLPAILGTSEFLQNKYSHPIYGATNSIQSKNFQDWSWIKKDAKGVVIDPYKLLPPIFSDLDLETMDSLITEGSLADGGAAMTAYARMQFTQMSEAERNRVSKALLRYCELDTFAMVMIYEYWRFEIESRQRKAA